MYVRSALLAVLLAITINCNGEKDTIAPNSNASAVTPTPTSAPIKTERISDARDVLITLERGACFGRCPQYKVSISGDGKVIFEGKENTKVKGKAEAELTEDEVKMLVEEFDKIRFFDLNDRYDQTNCPNAATDQSTVLISLKVGDKNRSISHYTGCVEGDEAPYKPYPAGLLTLENMIHDVVESLELTGPR